MEGRCRAAGAGRKGASELRCGGRLRRGESRAAAEAMASPSIACRTIVPATPLGFPPALGAVYRHIALTAWTGPRAAFLPDPPSARGHRNPAGPDPAGALDPVALLTDSWLMLLLELRGRFGG